MRHPILRTYYMMMSRCYNQKDPNYNLYGGAGVVVCDEWKSSKESFWHWSLNNGWEEGLELDKDINGDGTLYSPTTAKWVTHAENMRHLKSAKKHFYNGELRTLAYISQETGIPKSTFHIRLNSGKTIEEAIKMGRPKGKSGNTTFHWYNGELLTLRSIALIAQVSYPLLRFRVNSKGLSVDEALSIPIKTKNTTYFKHLIKSKTA